MKALPAVQLPIAGAIALKGFNVLGDPPREIRCMRCAKRWPFEGETPSAEQVRDMLNHHKRPRGPKIKGRVWGR